MSDARLVAHSITEARLYLMVTPCPSCSTGPLRPSQLQTTGGEAGGSELIIDASCSGCETASSFTFLLPPEFGADADVDTPRINTTDDPSRIIDVAHWLTLFRMGAEEAGHESDKTQARELWIESGQYLAEALKFYDDPDSDLPSEEAFFSDTSRTRLRENPEQFSRQRLINLRAKLPFPSASSSPTSSVKHRGGPRLRRPQQ